MGLNNGIITAPVSIDDVRSCLGAASYDLGTLCRGDTYKINLYSKYRPVSHYALDTPVLSTVNYGWTVAAKDTLTALITAWMADNGSETAWGWVPQLPSGGDASPYRLTDWAGYNHYAAYPLFKVSIEQTVLNPQMTLDFWISEGGALKISDFKSGLGNYSTLYYGICAVKAGETSEGYARYICTSTTGEVICAPAQLFARGYGDYRIYAFVSTVPCQNVNANAAYYLTSGKCSGYPLPVTATAVTYEAYVEPTLFTYTVTFSVDNSATPWKIRYDITAKNITTATQTCVISGTTTKLTYKNVNCSGTFAAANGTKAIAAGAKAIVSSGSFATELSKYYNWRQDRFSVSLTVTQGDKTLCGANGEFGLGGGLPPRE